MWNGEAQLSVQTFESVRKLVRCTEQEKRLERWVNTPPSEIVEDGEIRIGLKNHEGVTEDGIIFRDSRRQGGVMP
jgi:hypothetical protein